MEIAVYPNQPTKAGLYVVKWHGTGFVDFIRLCNGDDGLYAANGARTHYTRWQCSWSEPIEIFAPYGIPGLK
jgi:hypothetical protein